ncbi:hypothetical protein B484DRAFT_7361, partial [Ochromonadaceae sp. CCMP2298]
MARAQEFDYFGLTIFFTLLLYVFVLSLFLCLRRSNIKRVLEYRAVHTREPTQEDDFFDQATFSFEFRTDFEHVTQSSLGKGCKFFLLLSRLFCAIFFLSTAVVLNAVEDSHGLYYFTAWNSLMVMSFFICAASCSALSLYWKSKRNIYGRYTGVDDCACMCVCVCVELGSEEHNSHPLPLPLPPSTPPPDTPKPP